MSGSSRIIMANALPMKWIGSIRLNLPKLRKLLEPPDPSLVEAGAGGEKFVATTRLVFWIFISLAPLSGILAGGQKTPRVFWVALGGVILAIILSALVVLILRRGARIPTIGFITGAGDVTLISLTLAAAAVAGYPMAAIDSQITWAVYLLAILTTSLRFDIRVCLFVGLLTVAEYSALVLWVIWRWNVPISVYSTNSVAGTNLLFQVSRLMLMLATTSLSIGIVYRSRKLVYMSGTDRLTGLGNRSYFEERFAAELSRASRFGEPLTLAFFDIDRFKRFNDRWGHETGDAALKLVSRIIEEESRKEDILARWGGEEIALVLPGTSIEGALRKVERIRKRLTAEALIVKSEEARLTVSCGLAQFPSDGIAAEALFAAADRRLLMAKTAGRDRVVVDDSYEPV